MFTSLVLQLLMVLHKVHNSLLVKISEIDVGHVPLSCIATVMVPLSSSSLCFSVTSFCPGPFFECDASALVSSSPCLLLPLLLCLLPLSGLPLPPPLLDICHCVPSSNSGTLSVGTSIFLTLLPFLGSIVK